MRLVSTLFLVALLCATTTSTAAAKPALSMKAAWAVVYGEQDKELSGRYVTPHSGPISFENASCKRQSPRKIHCFYATFFNAPDPDEEDQTVGGYACGRSVDVRRQARASKPVRQVRWQVCEVLRYG